MHEACDSAMQRLLEHNFIVKSDGGSGDSSESGDGGEGGIDYGVAPTQLGRVSRSSNDLRSKLRGGAGRTLRDLGLSVS